MEAFIGETTKYNMCVDQHQLNVCVEVARVEIEYIHVAIERVHFLIEDALVLIENTCHDL